MWFAARPNQGDHEVCEEEAGLEDGRDKRSKEEGRSLRLIDPEDTEQKRNIEEG